jgi:hypothetical protein
MIGHRDEGKVGQPIKRTHMSSTEIGTKKQNDDWGNR